MLKRTLVLCAVLFAIWRFAPTLNAQSLPLGTLTVQSSRPFPCAAAVNGDQFVAGSSCYDATISNCPNVAPINLTFGWIGPASPQGTVVIFGGSSGTTPGTPGGTNAGFATVYALTFEVVQVEWFSAWEDPSQTKSGGNLLDAACRPATFLNYINSSFLHAANTAMCAQGSSAGSAEIAYSLAWYGAADYLNNVELLSGPTLSEIDQGCMYPKQPNLVICGGKNGGKQYGCTAATKPWTNNQLYVPANARMIDNWSGLKQCATAGGLRNLAGWKQMGLVNGSSGTTSPRFGYPNTRMHGWLCASYAKDSGGKVACTAPHCPNNSAMQGNYFYQQLNPANQPTGFQLTGVLACVQEEGVSDGTDPDSKGPASDAIIADMDLNCHL